MAVNENRLIAIMLSMFGTLGSVAIIGGVVIYRDIGKLFTIMEERKTTSDIVAQTAQNNRQNIETLREAVAVLRTSLSIVEGVVVRTREEQARRTTTIEQAQLDAQRIRTLEEELDRMRLMLQALEMRLRIAENMLIRLQPPPNTSTFGQMVP